MVAPGLLDKVAKAGIEIWDKLPHTPITAVGHNFGFLLDVDDYYLTDDTHLDDLVRKNLPKNMSKTLEPTKNFVYRNGFEFSGKDYVLNIIYEQNRENMRTLEYNFHYNVQNSDKEQIRSMITSFSENYALAQEIADKMIVRRISD